MNAPDGLPTDDWLSFGAFEFRPAERLLLRAGVPVALGGRALDLLNCLLARPGDVLTAEELLACAWRGVHVERAALRVQVRALRRALGAPDGAGDYVINVAGRGYRFAAPVRRRVAAGPNAATATDRRDLPGEHPRMVGRDEVVQALVRTVLAKRGVTVVGPGGIGKSTVAVAATHRLASDFDGEVTFVDLAVESHDANVAPAVAAALGLPGVDGDPLVHLAAQLGGRRLLLVLDSCERVVPGAAALVAALRRQAPGVHVLATSREPLGAPGEPVYRLEGLAAPPAAIAAPLAEVCAYPAAQLFVERARASGGVIGDNAAEAALVGDICRKLDGLPLALELAAGRVGAFGLAATRTLLDHRLSLAWPGRRTAAARHLSLSATLDWSYDLLGPEDAAALRALSVFVGGFAIEDAAAIVDPADRDDLPERLASLTAKSLIAAADPAGDAPFRLRDATRDYARAKLDASEEATRTARRHATWILGFFRGEGAAGDTRPMRDWMVAFSHRVQDMQAALEWAVSPHGDPALVAPLTLAGAPVWSRLGRGHEARDRTAAALAVVAPDSREEMALNIAMISCLYDVTPYDERRVRAVSDRALELADRFDDGAARLRAWWGHWNSHMGPTPCVPDAYKAAQRYRELARGQADPFAAMVGDRMLGVTELLRGEFRAALDAFGQAEATSPEWDLGARLAWHADDPDVMTRNMLVSMNWICGFPDAATAMARDTLERAEATGNLALQAIILANACGAVSAAAGDMAAVEGWAAQLDALVVRGAPTTFGIFAGMLRAIVAAQRGDPAPGRALVLGGLPPETGHPSFISPLTELARHLARCGAHEVAGELADHLQQRVERTGEAWIWSDVQCVRGELSDDPETASSLFKSALDLAQRQGAKSYALRAATGLARRRPSAAQGVLAPLLASFTEGAATKDQIEAREVLAACGL